MKKLIESIRNKSKLCNIDTTDGRIRKGAYVDCIIMIQEWEKANSAYPMLADVRALLTAIKNRKEIKCIDDFCSFMANEDYQKAEKEYLLCFKKVSEHFS